MNAVDHTIHVVAVRDALQRARAAAARPTVRRWTTFSLALDALMLASAALLEQVALRAAGAPTVPLPWLLALPALTLVALASRGLYRTRLKLELIDDLRLVLGATSIVAMALVTVRVLAVGDTAGAGTVVHQWLFSVVYLSAGRIGLSVALRRLRRTREVAIPTLIIGAEGVARTLARRLRDTAELGFLPVGHVALREHDTSVIDGLPVFDRWDRSFVVGEHEIGQVLLSEESAPAAACVEIVRDCHRAGVPIAIVPRLFPAVTKHVEIEHIGAVPLLSLRQSNPQSWRFALKYALDRLAAAAAIVLVSPVLAAVALVVRQSLGRPILFRQVRAGVDGRPFEMLKFRTMRAGGLADDRIVLGEDMAPGGVEGEDRRTRVGAFLRRTCIDELPQLFNVLRGDMSIVGPRPERPEFVRRFEQSVERYGERHRVKAGITGWAQVAGLRGRTSLSDRVEWDNWYIENWTPWLDVKIILLTLAAVVRARGTE